MLNVLGSGSVDFEAKRKHEELEGFLFGVEASDRESLKKFVSALPEGWSYRHGHKSVIITASFRINGFQTDWNREVLMLDIASQTPSVLAARTVRGMCQDAMNEYVNRMPKIGIPMPEYP